MITCYRLLLTATWAQIPFPHKCLLCKVLLEWSKSWRLAACSCQTPACWQEAPKKEKTSKICFSNKVLQSPSHILPKASQCLSTWVWKPLDSIEMLSISLAYNLSMSEGQGAVDLVRSLAGGGLFIRRRGMCHILEYLTPINWLAWGKIPANTRLLDVLKSRTASYLLFGIQSILGGFGHVTPGSSKAFSCLEERSWKKKTSLVGLHAWQCHRTLIWLQIGMVNFGV